jgi:hypothetical protein
MKIISYANKVSKSVTMKCGFTFIFFAVNLFSIAQDTIPLKKLAGNLKTIQVTIENKQYDFLFDTGGSETFISPDNPKLAKQTGTWSGCWIPDEW